MRKLEGVAAALVVVGALNWGLVAIAEFDLVAWLVGADFGETTAISRIVYALVGLAGVYWAAALLGAREQRERRERREHGVAAAGSR